jgi:hypothetical protein
MGEMEYFGFQYIIRVVKRMVEKSSVGALRRGPYRFSIEQLVAKALNLRSAAVTPRYGLELGARALNVLRPKVKDIARGKGSPRIEVTQPFDV